MSSANLDRRQTKLYWNQILQRAFQMTMEIKSYVNLMKRCNKCQEDDDGARWRHQGKWSWEHEAVGAIKHVAIQTANEMSDYRHKLRSSLKKKHDDTRWWLYHYFNGVTYTVSRKAQWMTSNGKHGWLHNTAEVEGELSPLDAPSRRNLNDTLCQRLIHKMVIILDGRRPSIFEHGKSSPRLRLSTLSTQR